MKKIEKIKKFIGDNQEEILTACYYTGGFIVGALTMKYIKDDHIDNLKKKLEFMTMTAFAIGATCDEQDKVIDRLGVLLTDKDNTIKRLIEDK